MSEKVSKQPAIILWFPSISRFNPTEISSKIPTDPYADIRKFTKFKDSEELVTRIVSLRDEGYNYRELWGGPMAVKIPSYISEVFWMQEA